MPSSSFFQCCAQNGCVASTLRRLILGAQQRIENIESRRPQRPLFGDPSRQLVDVSWEHAKSYGPRLWKRTGRVYRLLSEAEWEYCCRAGTTTKFAFGDNVTHQQAQFSEGEFGSANQTAEVGTFPPNAWGLHDMHGNVWEWCEDNWLADYKGAPHDGMPRQGGSGSLRVLRGGCWADENSGSLRSATRNKNRPAFAASSGVFVLPELSS